MPETRSEHDGLGEVPVPATALWGAQTQRAVNNFPVDGERTIGHYPLLIEALMAVKRAAAAANRDTGEVEDHIANAIIGAADEVHRQRLFDHFPVHRLHGGGGTSANMNANEVLANLAEEALGGQRGSYRLVHPNHHVNRNQSTNDVYPTACHLAVVAGWQPAATALDRLAAALRAAAERWRQTPRISRTCLQDAVSSTWGDVFGGYAGVVERCCTRSAAAVDALHEIPLGGTVIGRLDAVPEAYAEGVLSHLRRVTGDQGWRRTDNLAASYQSCDDMAAASAQLATAARAIAKLAKDLRLLASGPEAGIGELRLPAVQPGSSVMPGKVNPVIPEFAVQLALQVTGLDGAVAATVDHAELDLDVWESLAVTNLLDELSLLAAAADALTDRAVLGIEVDEKRSRAHADTLIPLLTRLARRHGYAAIADVCRRAAGDRARIAELLDAEGLVEPTE